MYGAAGEDNGVTVGFADLSTKGENGNTVSTIGSDSNGNLRANSDITINSKIDGDSYAAAIDSLVLSGSYKKTPIAVFQPPTAVDTPHNRRRIALLFLPTRAMNVTTATGG